MTFGEAVGGANVYNVLPERALHMAASHSVTEPFGMLDNKLWLQSMRN